MLIYGLIDPRDQIIKYVGVTSRKVVDRLKVHIYQSKHPRDNRPSLKETWINDLLKNNLRPVITVLEEVPEESWVVREKYWIEFYGNQLVNRASGGKGNFGFRWTEEQHKLWKGRPGTTTGMKLSSWSEEDREHHGLAITDEYRRKQALSHLGKKQTEETKRKISLAHRGERHPGAKLTESDIVEIRSRSLSGESDKVLAERFNVAKAHINGIVHRKYWRHI